MKRDDTEKPAKTQVFLGIDLSRFFGKKLPGYGGKRFCLSRLDINLLLWLELQLIEPFPAQVNGEGLLVWEQQFRLDLPTEINDAVDLSGSATTVGGGADRQVVRTQEDFGMGRVDTVFLE